MRRAWPLALVLIPGCGGGGGDTGFIEGRAGSVNLTFAGGTGYNGNPAPLNALTAIDGSATSKVVTINATNVNRGVDAALIAEKAPEGTVVDLAEARGSSSVVYTDTVGQWIATSGTLTLTTRTAASAQLTLTNVVLTNSSSTGAVGTVTLNGTMAFTGS